MSKFVFLVIITLTLHATVAVPITQDHDLTQKLDKVRDGALASIKNLNLDNVERRRAIVAHSSDFAYKIEQGINKIFKNFVRVNERYSHGSLPQIALRLNDVVHQVQETLIIKPSQLKTNLKENINRIYEEITKLIEIWNYYRGSDDAGQMESDVRLMIETLIEALHQLQIRGDFYNRNYDAIIESQQNIANQVMSTLGKIQWENRETVNLLTKSGFNFIHSLNHIIHFLKDELVQYHGIDPTEFKRIHKNMHEIRFRLESVLKRDNYNIERHIQDLKTQIRLTIHDFHAEITNLASIGKGFEGNVPIDNCVRNVIADCIHGEQNFQSKLDDIVNGHHV